MCIYGIKFCIFRKKTPFTEVLDWPRSWNASVLHHYMYFTYTSISSLYVFHILSTLYKLLFNLLRFISLEKTLRQILRILLEKLSGPNFAYTLYVFDNAIYCNNNLQKLFSLWSSGKIPACYEGKRFRFQVDSIMFLF